MEITIIALATLATFGRVLLLMFVAILSGWILGYIAIKNRVFENAYVIFISVFESIPVFSFIPIVLIIFIRGLGGGLGVEVAADFLVFTAIVWKYLLITNWDLLIECDIFTYPFLSQGLQVISFQALLMRYFT